MVKFLLPGSPMYKGPKNFSIIPRIATFNSILTACIDTNTNIRTLHDFLLTATMSCLTISTTGPVMLLVHVIVIRCPSSSLVQSASRGDLHSSRLPAVDLIV